MLFLFPSSSMKQTSPHASVSSCQMQVKHPSKQRGLSTSRGLPYFCAGNATVCTARLTYSGLEKPSHKCTVGANAGGNVLLFSFFFPLSSDCEIHACSWHPFTRGSSAFSLSSPDTSNACGKQAPGKRWDEFCAYMQ